MSMSTLLELPTLPDFQTGVLAGSLALVFLLVGRRLGLRMDWGIAVAGATLAGFQLRMDQRLSTTLGVALVGCGGWWLSRIGGRRKAHLLFAWIVLMVGAAIVAFRSALPENGWIPIAVPVVMLFLGYWMGNWEAPDVEPWLGPMFLVTAFGIWATVPQTASARILLGTSVPIALATTWSKGARISPAGGFALSAVVTWIAAAGGERRPGSIVGAWACVGLLVLVPMVKERLNRLPGWSLFGLHTAVVFLASRVIGFSESADLAALEVMVLLAIVYAFSRFQIDEPAKSPS